MKIIQLSDIHFSKQYSNSLLQKQQQFIDSVNSSIVDETDILILISGDIVNWGLKEEYENIAEPFFDDLKHNLFAEGKNIDFLFVPGNHDCDLSEDDAIRDVLISQIKEKNELADKEEIINKIIKQENFVEFSKKFHDNWVNINEIYSNQLVSLITYKQKFNFLILNTSWITTKKEKPGEMLFIEKKLKEVIDIIEHPTITIMHHPTNWLEPNNKRQIDNLIQSVSSVVLSGHEHFKTELVLKHSDRNMETLYIEGSCLQELDDPLKSEYNIINIKEDEMLLNNNLYSFDNGIYRKTTNNETFYKFKVLNANKIVDRIKINNNFNTFINDLGIVISHPRKKEIFLNDLFIFPDIEEFVKLNQDQELIENINVTDIIDFKDESIILFSGEKDSGKTSLLKIIFKYKLGEGIYPLIVNAEELKKDFTYNIEKLIRQYFENTFDKEGLDEYLQLSSDKRILFIEEWHKVKLNEEAKNRFIENASKYFKQIIIFLDSETSPTNYFISSEIPVRQFKILEFGHVKRDELIEKWITLGQEDYIEQAKLLNEIDRYKRAMEPILRNGFVPKYPLYLLVMLNSIETRQSHDLEKSSNGYYFEVLIKDSLIKIELEFNQIEKLNEYLTNFSYYVLKQSSRNVDNDEWKNFHEEHLKLYDLSSEQLEFALLKEKLLKAKVIRFKDSCYHFYYPYVFNYFVAQYYARNLKDRVIQNELLELTNNIHITENANILMFLTHLSKDSFITECVLTSASILLEDIEPSKLEKDIAEINKLCKDIFTPQINADMDAYENRKKLNEKLDEMEKEKRLNLSNRDNDIIEEEKEDIIDADEIQVMNTINTINKSFKMLDVLGQILRNYYGSLKGPEKYELSIHHFNLGLRLNNWILNQINTAAPVLNESLSQIITSKDNITREKAQVIANQFIFILCSLITGNNIWKIVNSGGTPDLNNTYLRIANEEKSVAIDLIILLIKIEYYEEFPYKSLDNFVKENKNNLIVMKIVRDVVKRYIYLNELSYNDKQKICQLARIKLSPKVVGSSGKR